MPWWQSCGWGNTLQKQLEAPLHKEWPCCGSRFHLVAAVTHIHFSQSHPELTNPGPHVQVGWAEARSTLSPAAGTANTGGSPGKEGEWECSTSSCSGPDLCTPRGAGTAAQGARCKHLLRQRFHCRPSIFSCHGFCISLLTTECTGKGQGTRKNRKPIGTISNKRLQQICHTISLLIKLNGLSRERHKRKQRFKYL